MTEITEGTEQREVILLKAAVTTTDQGIFEAVISTEAFDRENDRVSAAGMVKALSKWPRMIPLTWEHGEEPKDIVGVIDPASAKAVSGEVIASGKIDLESRLGGEAWRSFKAKSIGFSFHFMTVVGQGAVKNAKGGLDIMEFDVFEITSTRMPINNGTRVLGAKAADGAPDPVEELRVSLAEVTAGLKALSDRFDEQETARVEAEKAMALTGTARAVDELRQRSDQTVLAIATDGASLRKSMPAPKEEPPPEPASERELKQRSYEATLALLTGGIT